MNKYEIFEEVENKVVDWGYDKGILHAGPSTKQRRLKQYQKTEEEVDEFLLSAIKLSISKVDWRLSTISFCCLESEVGKYLAKGYKKEVEW